MFCSKCGQQISDSALFCKFCGTKVEVKSTSEMVNTNTYAPTSTYATVNSVSSYGSTSTAEKNKKRYLIATILVYVMGLILAGMFAYGAIGSYINVQNSNGMLKVNFWGYANFGVAAGIAYSVINMHLKKSLDAVIIGIICSILAIVYCIRVNFPILILNALVVIWYAVETILLYKNNDSSSSDSTTSNQ